MTFSELAKEITYIKSGNSKADTTVLESEIDRIFYEAYKLTPTEIDLVEKQAQ